MRCCNQAYPRVCSCPWNFLAYNWGTYSAWWWLVIDCWPMGRVFSGWMVTIPTLELCLSATGSSGIICGYISAALQMEVPSDRACVLMKFVLSTASPEAAHSKSENIICMMKEAIKTTAPGEHLFYAPLQFCSINKWLGSSEMSIKGVHLSL